MKYGIDYRYLAKGAATPVDNTDPVDVEVDDDQFGLIPNVGDYVDIPGDDPGMRNVPLKGRVRSRLFKYVMGYCYITIVVEDAPDEDWAKIRAKRADN
ncbi:MAG TPA: hypothetical protein VGU69_01550 [Rhizomicrobium sp.]|nr:hypothetical protein [Rhizomicrobium sp.]